jgi:electron transfer flavoprotein alpha subunit
LAQLIERETPARLFPHTYQVRDYAPNRHPLQPRARIRCGEAARRRRSLVMVRQLFQGKLNADYHCSGAGTHFASIQAGSNSADALAAGSASVEAFTPGIADASIRTKADEPFRESARSVDLTSAELIVSVGRGIKEQENLHVVEALAQALGAELAASRPICDNGWLPMERQVGSSGQTVSPKVYFAIGISGAIQHLVGMKGAKTIGDQQGRQRAHFRWADGFAGDLFEVVPALTEAVKKAKTQPAEQTPHRTASVSERSRVDARRAGAQAIRRPVRPLCDGRHAH